MLKQLEFNRLTKKMEAGTLTDEEFERAMQLMSELNPDIATPLSEELDAIENRLKMCNENNASSETKVKLIEQGMALMFGDKRFNPLIEKTFEEAADDSEKE